MSIKHKMIFFGAGASFGSDFINITPRVGRDLFEHLAIYDKNGWGSIPSKLANNFKPDFEVGMVEYGNIYSMDVSKLQRTMACYFFSFEPGPLNLYRELAKRIINAHWSGNISTTNYDQLLQRSFTREGFDLAADGTGLKFIKSEVEIKLILPHGSCNLFDANIKSPGKMAFNYRHFGISASKINMAIGYSEFKKEIINKIPPVMCYYEPIKNVNVGKCFIKEQRNRFEKKTLEADIICIIGARVNQNDNYIWGPLAKTGGRISYCSGVEAGEEFEEWKRCNRKSKNDKIIKKKFDEGFQEICEALEV